jgi:hypothetical protein
MSEEQIDSILRISHSFGLDFYDHALEPYYNEMADLQHENASHFV